MILRGNKLRLVSVVVSGVAAVILMCLPVRTSAPGVNEATAKAIFLYNFTIYVDWPNNAFKGQGDPYVIGVLGDGPTGDSLKALENKPSRDRYLKSVRLDPNNYRREDLLGVHILFIENAAKDQASKALEFLESNSVLTVADWEGFAQQGGMINFRLNNERVGMDVNARTAEKAGLKISGKLLQVSNVVTAP